MPRKNPVLLREAPLSGKIRALTNYSRKDINGRDVIEARNEGAHDVTADFDAIVLEHLLDPDAGNICAILDGAAEGMELDDKEKEEIRAFRIRLVELIERHNDTGHGKT